MQVSTVAEALSLIFFASSIIGTMKPLLVPVVTLLSVYLLLFSAAKLLFFLNCEEVVSVSNVMFAPQKRLFMAPFPLSLTCVDDSSYIIMRLKFYLVCTLEKLDCVFLSVIDNKPFRRFCYINLCLFHVVLQSPREHGIFDITRQM